MSFVASSIQILRDSKENPPLRGTGGCHRRPNKARVLLCFFRVKKHPPSPPRGGNIPRALRNYPSMLATSLLLFFIQTESFAQGAGRAKVLEGNRAYAEEKFDEANDKYRDAQVDNPESPIIHFNIGDALYQKRNYEEALKSYQSAVQKSNDPQLQAQGYYNLGNTLFRMDKLQESIAAYQQALKLNPNDEDAKFNLEYVRRKLKENAQKQPQEQNQKITPSEFAKKLKAQAEALVAQRSYKEAHELLQNGLKQDPTVAAFQDFIQRIKDVVDIGGEA